MKFKVPNLLAPFILYRLFATLVFDIPYVFSSSNKFELDIFPLNYLSTLYMIIIKSLNIDFVKYFEIDVVANGRPLHFKYFVSSYIFFTIMLIIVYIGILKNKSWAKYVGITLSGSMTYVISLYLFESYFKSKEYKKIYIYNIFDIILPPIILFISLSNNSLSTKIKDKKQ